MRVFLLFIYIVSLWSCEDTKSSKINKSVKKKLQTTVQKSKSADTIFTLNNNNVMPFFMAYDKKHKANKVRITTDFGTIELQLFEATKFHRSNFIYLAKKGYFNGTQFYRVIDNFMIQGGNSDDQMTRQKRQKIGKYLLPNDYKKGFKHHRGVISMPSSDIDNPYKKASPYEFFIVQQRGGAHHLDGDYTVFGQVTKGMNIVDQIAKVPTDDADWPLRNVYIRQVEIIE